MNIPDTMNWHITYQCNYMCSFCFFRNPEGRIPQAPRLGMTLEQAYGILEKVKEAGIRRINYAGGEPTLVREFPSLVDYSHEIGLSVSVVTNGSDLTDKLLSSLQGKISAIKLSIDSSSETTEKELGRGYGHHIQHTIAVSEKIRAKGIKVMANTVVTSLNYTDDMHTLIQLISPDRWKVFQVLPIEGQNLVEYEKLKVAKSQFERFVKLHSDIPSMFPEDNDLMTESYLMMDPKGRFFQNSGSKYKLSSSVLNLSVKEAFEEIAFNHEKFDEREVGNQL